MKFVWVIVLIYFFSNPLWANRYDDEEKLRRAAQELADRANEQERQEREAAKWRYEREHPQYSDSTGGTIFVIIMLVGGLILIYVKIGQKIEKVLSRRNEERERDAQEFLRRRLEQQKLEQRTLAEISHKEELKN